MPAPSPSPASPLETLREVAEPTPAIAPGATQSAPAEPRTLYPSRRSALTPSAIALTLLLLLASAPASAEVKLYATGDEQAPAMIVGDRSVIFVHRDGKPYRVYEVKASTALHVTDIDGDNKPDVLGIGKPTFLLSGDGSPLWFDKKGCSSGALADIVADDKLDIACSTGKELAVRTFDDQFVWGASIGRALKECRAQDTNGDLKADIECSINSKRHARFDASGELIDAEISEPMIAPDALAYTPATPIDLAILGDGSSFDLDKDGAKNDLISVEDQLLVIKTKGRPKPMSMVEFKGALQGVMVQDLNQDGAPEVIALSDEELLVLSPDGSRQERYSLKASSYTRKPVAELQSVYANGFEDTEAAKKEVTDIQQALAQCYAGQLKKTQLAGSGQMLLEIKVADEGKVSQVNTLHSDVADKKVAECAIKNFKKIAFPKPSGEQGAVNVTIRYTFRDE